MSIYPHQGITFVITTISQSNADNPADKDGLRLMGMRTLNITKEIRRCTVQVGQAEWADGPTARCEARRSKVATAETVKKVDFISSYLI